MSAHGIPTVYRGIWFRSRLEARWAAVFDRLGWPLEYEPIDLRGYISDFVLRLPRAPLLVEVKGECAFGGLAQYAGKIESSGWEGEALIVGAMPFPSRYYDGQLALGLLVERGGDLDRDWCWDEGTLFTCTNCGRPSVYHALITHRCRVAGCYDGRHFLGEFTSDEWEPIWNEAGAITRWRPPRRVIT